MVIHSREVTTTAVLFYIYIAAFFLCDLMTPQLSEINRNESREERAHAEKHKTGIWSTPVTFGQLNLDEIKCQQRPVVVSS